MDEFFAEEEEIFADYGEQGFQTEAKAYERVGPSGKLAELLSSSGDTPEDRFLINADALCRRLNGDSVVKLTELDITNILESTTRAVGIEYKNYAGYVLGYIASQGGKTLKVPQVQHVIKDILPYVAEEGGLAPADVVRYARFWKEFL